jgi:hypothetical protein
MECVSHCNQMQHTSPKQRCCNQSRVHAFASVGYNRNIIQEHVSLQIWEEVRRKDALDIEALAYTSARILEPTIELSKKG